MTKDIFQDSLYIPYRDGSLHLRHIRPTTLTPLGIPILMLHGAMSNGRVFYSDTGRGLGCFLAKAGFDVYVMDTAGRGLSKPVIDRHFSLGQGEVIREQLPLVQHFITKRHPLVNKVHWCAHSWGGVLMASSLARYTHLQSSVASLLTFGSKRTIKVKSFKKWLMVDFFWNRFAPLYIAKQGYFDASRLRVGMDNESRASLLQTIDWVKGDWIDHDDHFHYAQAATKALWPPAWFIAGENDHVLGNPSDVRDMIDECGFTQIKYTLLAKEKGNLMDYNHAGMLTERQAEQDHFVQIKQWYLGLAEH
ncbi:alpha/beta fold hydrolase [Shewanella sp. H8]|uniref:alpha/beta fold hydrolase n=1 Tax=Shewanella sp. H8 TaxID=3342676 RepID=UPI0033148961